MPYETMVRLKIATDDTRLEDDLRDLRSAPSVQVEVIRNLFEEKKERSAAATSCRRASSSS